MDAQIQDIGSLSFSRTIFLSWSLKLLTLKPGAPQGGENGGLSVTWGRGKETLQSFQGCREEVQTSEGKGLCLHFIDFLHIDLNGWTVCLWETDWEAETEKLKLGHGVLQKRGGLYRNPQTLISFFHIQPMNTLPGFNPSEAWREIALWASDCRVTKSGGSLCSMPQSTLST